MVVIIYKASAGFCCKPQQYLRSVGPLAVSVGSEKEAAEPSVPTSVLSSQPPQSCDDLGAGV